LVVEIVVENSANGEYTEKARWYAERGIPEYWIVDRTPDRAQDESLVHLHRLTASGAIPGYVRERSVLLSELEAEYASGTDGLDVTGSRATSRMGVSVNIGDSQEAAMTDLATAPILEPEIDQELLAEVQRQISATSLNGAINEALRRLVEQERAKRRAALEKLQQMHDEGLFDYSRLDRSKQ
jgi:Arc/MetJ family transcription regulator